MGHGWRVNMDARKFFARITRTLVRRLLTLSTASDPWTGGRERVVGLGLLVFSDQTFEMYVSGVSDLVVVRLEGRRPLLISPDDIQLFAEVVEPRIIRHVAGTERDSGG